MTTRVIYAASRTSGLPSPRLRSVSALRSLFRVSLLLASNQPFTALRIEGCELFWSSQAAWSQRLCRPARLPQSQLRARSLSRAGARGPMVQVKRRPVRAGERSPCGRTEHFHLRDHFHVAPPLQAHCPHNEPLDGELLRAGAMVLHACVLAGAFLVSCHAALLRCCARLEFLSRAYVCGA